MLQKKNYQIIALSGFVAVVGISAVAACSSTTETTDPGTSSSGGTKDAGKTSSSTSSSSGSTSSTSSTTSSSGSTTSSSGSTTSSSGADASTSSSGGPDPAVCGAKAKQADCQTCCDPMAKSNVLIDAFLTCACTAADGAGAPPAGGGCKTECAAEALCKDHTSMTAPAKACDDCLNGAASDGCFNGPGADACKKDTGCVAAENCFATAKCADIAQ